MRLAPFFELTVFNVTVEIGARTTRLIRRGVLVSANAVDRNLVLLHQPSSETDRRFQLRSARTLFVEIAHHFDADVPGKRVFGVRFGLVFDRSSFKDEAVRR